MAIELGTTDISRLRIGTTHVKDTRMGSGSPIYSNYYDSGTQSYPMIAGFTSGSDGSVSFNASNIVLQAGTGGFNSTTNERTARTTNAVDLTNIKTLYLDCIRGFIRGTGESSITYLVVSTSGTGSYATFNARASLTTQFVTARTILSLNVSGLTGSYFLRVHQRDFSTSGTQGAGIEVYRIWGI